MSGEEAWWERAREELQRGVRPTVGAICNRCLGLIPRVPEVRHGLTARMCACGEFTSLVADMTAHGLTPDRTYAIDPRRAYRVIDGESR